MIIPLIVFSIILKKLVLPIAPPVNRGYQTVKEPRFAERPHEAVVIEWTHDEHVFSAWPAK